MTVAGAVSEPLTVVGQIATLIGSESAAAKLIENFDVAADSAGGIQRLRGLILELAVRGTLVPQDRRDEPVSVLLDHVAEEKLHLVKSGKLGSDKAPPQAVRSEEVAFEIPPSWRWSRFGIICDTRLGKMLDKAKNRGTLRPYLRNANLQWFRFDLTDVLELRLADDEVEEHSVRVGDLLICEGGEPGRAAICDDTVAGMAFQKALHRARPFCGIDSKFLAYLLRCDTWAGRLDARFTGATIKHFTGKALREYPVPLPPLPEQKRIVAKIDQLMALCDEFDAQQAKRRAVGASFSRSALDKLAAAPTPADFALAWPRVDANFGILIDRAASVAALRSAILEMGVRGRLTRPDSSDAPVTALLERIDDERRRRLGSSNGARPDPTVSEQPFEIPKTWRWTRWGGLTLSTDAGWSPECEKRRRVPPEWGVVKVSAVSWDRFDPEANKALPSNLPPRTECAIRKGDFLMSRANTVDLVGRSVIVHVVTEHLLMSDKIVRCEFSSSIDARFLNYFNRTTAARRHYAANASGTSDSMRNISRDAILNMPVPLPPAAEQRRIADVLDQYMVLCDELEAGFQRLEGYASQFADAAIAAVTTPGRSAG